MLFKTKKIFEHELIRIVPLLSNNRIKGDNGKFAIIGGCFEYTGAPYYVGISSLRAGADLSHIFCTLDAGTPIKTYSPELIVHPSLPYNYSEDNEIKLNWIKKWLKSMHGYTIGPGLGRYEFLGEFLYNILSESNEKQIVIIDADGLWHLLKTDSLYNYIIKRKLVFLTPNVGEFDRLWEKAMNGKVRVSKEEKDKRKNELYIENSGIVELDLNDPIAKDAIELSKQMNNINLIAKGDIDIITNGKYAYAVFTEGCLKRCGGQGDILAGLLMVYSYWANEIVIDNISDDEKLLLGGVLACVILRKAAKKSFEKKFIGLTAPDIIEYIIEAFLEIYKKI